MQTKVNKRAVGLLMEHMEEADRRQSRKALGQGFRALPPDEGAAKKALTYLDAFGYLADELSQWKDITLEDIVKAVGQFQSFFGLKKTGQLCVKTIKAMEQPRCGCPDVVRQKHAGTRRLRDFINQNLPRWRKDGITYTIRDYVPGISKPDFESVVFNSFQAWTRYGNVDVNPARGGQTPDIVISTGRGQADNFDGPSGTLAWAYLPDGSDRQLLMKFDLDETFVLSPTQRGILLPNVATHEFGHLMGLDHSKLQSALMAPYYNAALAVPQQQDDVPRFQVRYGVRAGGGQTPPTPPAGVSQLIVRGQFASVELDGKKVA